MKVTNNLSNHKEETFLQSYQRIGILNHSRLTVLRRFVSSITHQLIVLIHEKSVTNQLSLCDNSTALLCDRLLLNFSCLITVAEAS